MNWDQQRIGTLMVLLMIMTWAQTSDQTSRFLVPKYCREDPACNPPPSSTRIRGILFVIGRDRDGEVQTVLENTGLWDAMKWKKLLRFDANTYAQIHLNKRNLEAEVFDLRNEVLGKKTPDSEGLCIPLVEASMAGYPIVVFAFDLTFAVDFKTRACRKSLTNESFILVTSPGQNNSGTSGMIHKQALWAFKNLITRLGIRARALPFSYMNRTPGQEDVAGWTEFLESRKALNGIFARGSSALIQDPLCFSPSPSQAKCDIGMPYTCEKHQAVPYTKVATRNRRYYINLDCSAEPSACRDCNPKKTRVPLIRRAIVPPSHEEVDSDGRTHQNSEIESQSGTDQQGNATHESGIDQHSGIKQQSGTDQQGGAAQLSGTNRQSGIDQQSDTDQHGGMESQDDTDTLGEQGGTVQQEGRNQRVDTYQQDGRRHRRQIDIVGGHTGEKGNNITKNATTKGHSEEPASTTPGKLPETSTGGTDSKNETNSQATTVQRNVTEGQGPMGSQGTTNQTGTVTEKQKINTTTPSVTTGRSKIPPSTTTNKSIEISTTVTNSQGKTDDQGTTNQTSSVRDPNESSTPEQSTTTGHSTTPTKDDGTSVGVIVAVIAIIVSVVCLVLVVGIVLCVVKRIKKEQEVELNTRNPPLDSGYVPVPTDPPTLTVESPAPTVTEPPTYDDRAIAPGILTPSVPVDLKLHGPEKKSGISPILPSTRVSPVLTPRSSTTAREPTSPQDSLLSLKKVDEESTDGTTTPSSRQSPNPGRICNFQVLLMMMTWAQTSDQTSRFLVPKYCREDQACNPPPSSTRIRGILFVIGRDRKGEAQTVLENTGLWDAIKWTKLMRFNNNTYTRINLNKINLEAAVFDLRNEVLVKEAPDSGSFCIPLLEASRSGYLIVVLAFNTIFAADLKARNCRNSLTNGSLILLTSPGQHSSESPGQFQKDVLGAFDDLITRLGVRARLYPFGYINHTPSQNDVAGWTELLESRKALNRILARGSSPPIPDPLCFSPSPSKVQCNSRTPYTCEKYQNVPYTKAATRNRNYYINLDCSAEPSACRDCSLERTRVRLIRRAIVASSYQELDSDGGTDQKSKTEGRDGTDQQGVVAQKSGTNQKSGIDQQSDKDQQSGKDSQGEPDIQGGTGEQGGRDQQSKTIMIGSDRNREDNSTPKNATTTGHSGEPAPTTTEKLFVTPTSGIDNENGTNIHGSTVQRNVTEGQGPTVSQGSTKQTSSVTDKQERNTTKNPSEISTTETDRKTETDSQGTKNQTSSVMDEQRDSTTEESTTTGYSEKPVSTKVLPQLTTPTKDGGTPAGVIVGVIAIIVSVVCLAIVSLIVFCVIKRMQEEKEDEPNTPSLPLDSGFVNPPTDTPTSTVESAARTVTETPTYDDRANEPGTWSSSAPVHIKLDGTENKSDIAPILTSTKISPVLTPTSSTSEETTSQPDALPIFDDESTDGTTTPSSRPTDDNPWLRDLRINESHSETTISI